MTVEAFAPAKVNLTLNVTGRRADGYHLLHSLVGFTPQIGDRIAVEPADGISLSVCGPMANGVPTDSSNIVLKAAHLLASLRGVSMGAAITLEKHLPNASGIGGGSADAAAAIKALSQLWNVDPLTGHEALPLGADVPVCLAGPDPQIMAGIGEDLAASPTLPQCWILLVNPGVAAPTRDIFSRLGISARTSSLTAPPAFRDLDGFCDWLAHQKNDLLQPALELAPEIGVALRTLRGTGPSAANMSGSGATVWGIFDDRPSVNSAAEFISDAHPNWWVRSSQFSMAI